MTKALNTYDIKKVIVTYGAHTLTGFKEGSSISVTELSDGVTSEVGLDGEVARAMSSGTILEYKFSLQNTSASNSFLSRQIEIDRITGANTPPLTISDGRGKSIHVSTSAWITKKPDAEYSEEITGREWVLHGTNTENVIGGTS